MFMCLYYASEKNRINQCFNKVSANKVRYLYFVKQHNKNIEKVITFILAPTEEFYLYKKEFFIYQLLLILFQNCIIQFFFHFKFK